MAAKRFGHRAVMLGKSCGLLRCFGEDIGEQPQGANPRRADQEHLRLQPILPAHCGRHHPHQFARPGGKIMRREVEARLQIIGAEHDDDRIQWGVAFQAGE